VSLADAALQEGFISLLATAGEEVTFRALTFTALIDRVAYQDQKREKSLPDFDAHAISRIEIPLEDVTGRPKTGEIITDSREVNHRIVRVSHTGLAWACDCEVLEE
jgi:hypothetical protein